MRYLTLLLLFLAAGIQAQQNMYDAWWKQAKTLEQAARPAAAMQYADSIHLTAKVRGDLDQEVKSLIYKIKLASEYEENVYLAYLQQLDTSLVDAEGIRKAVLSSLRAELLWRYYRQHFHIISERTSLLEAGEDMAFWDARTFSLAIASSYLNSLNDWDRLLQSPVRDLALIMDTAEGSAQLRPSLADLLAYRALEFLRSPEAATPFPGEKRHFHNEEVLLTDARSFSALEFDPTRGPAHQALLIYQQLLRSHSKGKDVYPLIYNDLERLSLVKDLLSSEKANKLYRNALEALRNAHPNHPAFVDITLRLAEDLVRTGTQYQPPKDTAHRYDIREAIRLLEEAVKRYPEAYLSPRSNQYIAELRSPGLSLEHPGAIPPEEAFPLLLQWKNLSRVTYRLIPENYAQYRKNAFQQRPEALIKMYEGRLAKEQGSWPLTDQGDYQTHRTEVPLKGLPKGFYVLTGKGNVTNFSDTSQAQFITSLWISDISFFYRQEESGGLLLYVSARSTGKPLDNTIVSVYHRIYDYRSRSYRERPGEVVVTDKDGLARLQASKDGQETGQIFLTFQHQDDFYVSDEHFYLGSKTENQEKKQFHTRFFTDRAVYRPGQLVYFKGIHYASLASEYEVIPNEKLKVNLSDANGKNIASLELVTNDYGSVEGSFPLPPSGLTGSFRIFSRHGSQSFLVEEYKRPRFEVRLDKPAGEYQLGDTVTVPGTARAYAGNAIPNARVHYTITRTVFFPYPYRWESSYFPPYLRGEVIEAGETSTDEEGRFLIAFQALSSNEIPLEGNPVFHFRVNASIADISGEVQEGSTSLRVGSRAFDIGTDIPDNIPKNTGHSYALFTRNANGKRIATQVTLEIFPIEKPDRMLRSRPWPAPDQYALDAVAYRKLFPLDHYGPDQSLPEVTGEALRTYTYETGTDSLMNLNTFTYLAEGKYLLRFSAKDRNGNLIRKEQMIRLFDAGEGPDPFNAHLWTYLNAQTALPGESLELVLSSGAKALRLMVEVSNADGLKQRSWVKLDGTKKVMKIPVEASDEGGLFIHIQGVHANRILSAKHHVSVQRKGIAMELGLTRFRRELEAGEAVEWALHFKGDDESKVLPELLLGMYDASLDVIRPHHWHFPLSYPVVRSYFWTGQSGFGLQNARIYIPFTERIPAKVRNFDQINWQGLDFYWGGGQLYRYAMADGALSENVQMKTSQELDNAAPGMVAEDEVVADSPPSEAENNEGSQGGFLRRDLAETAFFFPRLQPDPEGGFVIRFQAPEALTRWNLMGLAHTNELRIKTFVEQVITSRKLMVIPNLPRLLYQGDEIVLRARVTSMATEEISGQGQLVLKNAISGEALNESVRIIVQNETFKLNKGESAALAWRVIIPPDCPPLLEVSISATDGKVGDGEVHLLPVLPSRTLVTETHTVYLPGSGNKTIRLPQWEEGMDSLRDPWQLSVEYTANPVWNVVQALPYLMEEDSRASSAIFHRFFANSLGLSIVSNNPSIESVFRIWQQYQPQALWSALEKNEDLKSIVLNETPWVREAGEEREAKSRLGHYFQQDQLSSRLAYEWQELQKLQSDAGGWPWHPGMPLSRHITADILSGMSFLYENNALEMSQEQVQSIIRASEWLLSELTRDKAEMARWNKDYLKRFVPSSRDVFLLFAIRPWLEEMDVRPQDEETWQFYYTRAMKAWTSYSLQVQAQLGRLALYASDEMMVDSILLSFRDRALRDEDGSMYWRDLKGGYSWDSHPEAAMARMIQFFAASGAAPGEIDAMRSWLLRRKQVAYWEGSVATAMACQAMLGYGSSWLEGPAGLSITIGTHNLPGSDKNLQTEAGSGYFRKTWKAEEIKPDMGVVNVQSTADRPSWGAVYYQYFSEQKEVRAASEGLDMRRSYYRIREDKGVETLVPLDPLHRLVSGERIRVRLEIENSRDLEFVHLKDPRPAAFEPADKVSSYQYGGGLGYYQSIRDAAMHFFFAFLPAGKNVMEYDVFVNQEGRFSAGPASIQCLYAPEYRAHTEGISLETAIE